MDWEFLNSEEKAKLEKKLLVNIKQSLPALKELLQETNKEWVYEERVYRFYHGSFKVYYAQEDTLRIVQALSDLLPGTKLNSSFQEIISEGTGKTFSLDVNERWDEETRPIIEAFFHAKFMLEMAVKYGHEKNEITQMIPTGWATLLYLYDIR